jgi:hypothetical protein
VIGAFGAPTQSAELVPPATRSGVEISTELNIGRRKWLRDSATAGAFCLECFSFRNPFGFPISFSLRRRQRTDLRILGSQALVVHANATTKTQHNGIRNNGPAVHYGCFPMRNAQCATQDPN